MLGQFGVRLKEPSTWQGIIGFASVLGVQLSPEQQNAIAGLGVAVYLAIDVFFSHGSNPVK